MGCCTTMEPNMNDVGSDTVGSAKSTLSGPKRYSTKTEPQLSYEMSQNTKSEDKSKESDPSSYFTDDFVDPLPLKLTHTKSEFQLKMEHRRSELMLQRQKLKELQHVAFNRQLTAQQSKFQRLYDVWEQFCTSADGRTMDIDGLTGALAVFGMIIDTDRDFQRHIFHKFDIDNEKEITYNDFSSTIASFVGSNTDDDSLQTLFEIFDIDQDGYLEIEDMARILLAQNQIAVVVTGQQSDNLIVYTKKQCIKQARRMVAQYDTEHANHKISFNEYKHMMQCRTENEMILDHNTAPSISVNIDDEISYRGSYSRHSEVPRFIAN